MMHYERSYATARFVFAMAEIGGWGLIVVGALLIVLGVATGGILSAFFDQTLPAARILAALPGLGISFTGLIVVANVQTSRAHVDTAEISRMMLKLALRQHPDATDLLIDKSNEVFDEMRGVTILSPPFSNERAEVVYEYRGWRIFKVNNRFFIEGDRENLDYYSLHAAKLIIDSGDLKSE